MNNITIIKGGYLTVIEVEAKITAKLSLKKSVDLKIICYISSNNMSHDLELLLL